MEYADILRILDLKVSFRAIDDITLPFFKGNALRTVLGKSFKNVVCSSPSRQECSGCMLEKLCPYSKMFPTKSNRPDITGASIPYIAAFHQDTKRNIIAGSDFSIQLRLFGPAVSSYPYFYLSLENMASKGLGNRDEEGNRGKAELISIHELSPDGSETCIFSKDHTLPVTDPKGNELRSYFNPLACHENMSIRILSPLRLKYRNSFDRTGDFHILLRSCLRRFESLCLLAFESKPELPWEVLLQKAYSIRNISENILWLDYRRYSSNQKKNLLLGGITGKLEYEGNLSDLDKYIQLGEVLGVGKGTSFGFGRYKVEP